MNVLGSSGLFSVFALDNGNNSTRKRFAKALSPKAAPRSVTICPINLRCYSNRALAIGLPSICKDESTTCSPDAGTVVGTSIRNGGLIFGRLKNLMYFAMGGLPGKACRMDLAKDKVYKSFRIISNIVTGTSSTRSYARDCMFSPLTTSKDGTFCFPLPANDCRGFALGVVNSGTIQATAVSFSKTGDLSQESFIGFPSLSTTALSIAGVSVSPFGLLGLSCPNLRGMGTRCRTNGCGRTTTRLLACCEGHAAIRGVDTIRIASIATTTEGETGRTAERNNFHFCIGGCIRSGGKASSRGSSIFCSFLTDSKDVS